jgi:hypothetical protein
VVLLGTDVLLIDERERMLYNVVKLFLAVQG